jgi:hypothetical protein
MYGLIILALIAVYYTQDSAETRKVTWTEFEQAALNGDITKVVVSSENGSAKGSLTKDGAKSLKMEIPEGGEARIETDIPSPEKFQDRLDQWNNYLAENGKGSIELNFEKGSSLTKF